MELLSASAAKPAAPAKTAAAGKRLQPNLRLRQRLNPQLAHTGANPNRQLFKRSTYAGYKDTGPVAGETFEQKVARLKQLSAAAKQRAEEGGGEHEAAEVETPPVVQAAETNLQRTLHLQRLPQRIKQPGMLIAL